MQVKEIIARLRSMNHLIELDPECLPELEEDDEWLEGWVRFHDTMTGILICVNECCEELDEQGVSLYELGLILLTSGNNYDNSVTVPQNQLEKYILAEQMKSNSLLAASQAINSKVSFSL